MRLFTILIAAAAALCGCGTKGPLEYPLRPGAAAPQEPVDTTAPTDTNKDKSGPDAR